MKLHVALAAANLSAAASAGILLGLDKVYHFLPGFVLANVFAHAHLAAVGWATMTVVGVGYRLLPMVIPAKAPSGITVYRARFSWSSESCCCSWRSSPRAPGHAPAPS